MIDFITQVTSVEILYCSGNDYEVVFHRFYGNFGWDVGNHMLYLNGLCN